ncbi:MAG TPA: DEAD/DEAH box helicase [Phycisphaerales bacterium]|nr:DEAD/DEAH box helicase [Phycisphaerales bacterium]
MAPEEISPQSTHPETNQPPAEGDAGDAPKKKRRRRRRRKPGEADGAAGGPAQATEAGAPSSDESRPERAPRAEREPRAEGDEGGPRKKRRRRRGRSRAEGAPGEADAAPEPRDRRRVRRAPGDVSNAEVFEQQRTFHDLGLSEDILRGLDEAGFKQPTYIQASLIPPAIEGRDVLGQAKTGTGKTAAFGLPLLHLCEPGLPMQAVILAPTRELAIQITEEINDLGRYCASHAVTIYGGQRIMTQVDKLRNNPEIIVGTPGRVLDMVDRGHLHFKNIRFAVLDEVDRMFDIGFRDDIRRILRQCPNDRQTIVVSATFNPEIEDLARRYMRDPEKIVTSAGSLTASLVEQHYLTVEPWDKKRLLLHVLQHEEPALTLIFCRLKRTVDELARYLSQHGVEAHAMHGDLSQSQRTATMRRFKEGGLAVLIASDLASRGIDVDGISHVVNYDLPDDPDLYVHRIGRTARAGMRGVAWSFVTSAQGKLLTQIEHLVNAEIPKLDYPDFEHAPRPGGWRDEPTGGRPPLDIPETAPAKSRFATDAPSEVAQDEATLAAKFPGGVVPTKLPPKRMQGRVRTRGR